MSTRDFAPRPMKLSILTAAFQELTPRNKRDPDPDLAIEEWLEFARVIGSPNIQLSAALHPTLSDVPEEAMLDPVANTLDLRTPFDQKRAARVLAAMKSTGVGLSDLGRPHDRWGHAPSSDHRDQGRDDRGPSGESHGNHLRSPARWRA